MRTKLIIRLGVALTLVLMLGSAAHAEPYSFDLGVLLGVGGSPDAEPDIGLSNPSWQINLGMVTEPRTHLVTRVGQLDLSDPKGFAGLGGAELTYITVAGEYRYFESLYDSGIFLGLGAYRLEGQAAGGSQEDTSIGATFGVNGEFRITGRWNVIVELAAHWADFEDTNVFTTGQVGVGLHF